MPILAELQKEQKLFDHVLFRYDCTRLPLNIVNITRLGSKNEAVYVKDLSRLGRDLRKVIIVDNCPDSYML